MPRFVLLRHDCPADYRDGPHWDLMLQREGTTDEHHLATWSLLELPKAWGESLPAEPSKSFAGASSIAATQLPDHRATYLTYEGPVSGNRGTVSRVAAGAIEWVEVSQSRYVVRLLESSPLRGTVMLDAVESGQWLLTLT